MIVADDSVLFREGLARILAEIGFEVAGQASDASSLVALALRTAPDVVITDLRMPQGLPTKASKPPPTSEQPRRMLD